MVRRRICFTQFGLVHSSGRVREHSETLISSLLAFLVPKPPTCSAATGGRGRGCVPRLEQCVSRILARYGWQLYHLRWVQGGHELWQLHYRLEHQPRRRNL